MLEFFFVTVEKSVETVIEANAKVNIALKVGPRRSDGYHGLKTLFHLITLSDLLALDIKDSLKTEVTIKGNESYLAGGEDLMAKAARRFSLSTGKTFRLFIEIEKRIPFEAGCGGGSADAAAVLRFLNGHYNNILNNKELLDLALKVGSDVPFLASGFDAAYAEGRGELLKEVEAVSYPILLLKRKGEKVSTLEAFRLIDEKPPLNFEETLKWPSALDDWQKLYQNDFSPFSLLGKTELYRSLSSFASFESLTGSGSVRFLVFETEGKREECLKRLRESDGSLVWYLAKLKKSKI